MGFDKVKSVRAAEKYLAQNKISSAIQEYRRIAENDASDFNALNTLGDLYVRVDKKQEAIECFKRVAEHYHQQGFALKAVAVYKKITRFTPDAPDVAAALAALYEQQGLLIDARNQYLLVADSYARQGQNREALEVLRRIADLDPNNIKIRLRLAESYLTEGMNDSAAEAFIEAGERLLSRGEHEQSLAAFTKAVAWRPHSHAALQGLVFSHAALGTADEAAEALEKAVADRPGDLELRLMLVRAYVEAENARSAETAALDLVIRDPSSYAYLFDVARLHLRQGGTNDAVSVVARVVEPALSGRQEETLLELLQEALARDPEQIEALRLLVRVYTVQRDDERLRAALENLAETAETLGLADDERHALAQLVKHAPFETRYRERLEELGGSVEDEPPPTAATAGDLHAPDDETPGDVPTFESFMLSNETFESSSSPTTPTAQETTEFEWNSVETPAAAAPPPSQDASASFADLNFDFTDSAGSSLSEAEAVASEPSERRDAATEFGFAPAGFEDFKGTANAPPAHDAYAASVLAQELESVDFYLEQGYADIARDTLDMLERQYGAQPEIEARRRRLSAGVAAPGASAASVKTQTQDAPEAFEAVEFTGDAMLSAVEAETPATRIEAPDETHAPAFEQSHAFEESSVFEESSAFGETPAAAIVAPAPPTGAAAAVTTPTGNPPAPAGIHPELADVFDEFREAVEEAEPSEDGDFETHYNLGLAYKEMELLDQAVEEFQTAAGMAAPRDGTARYLNCCNLLGHCFMRKGVPRAAAIWFRKGLEAPGHTDDEYQALRYELGTAYEEMGDLARAIDTFTEVYGIDVSYRGVAQKLRELQARKEVTSDK